MDVDIYTVKLPYPDRPKKPVLLPKHTVEQAREHVTLLEAWEKAHAEYEQQRNAYRDEEHRLMDKFKADALEELGLMFHPKAKVLWDKAWDHGHANGLSEVWYWAQELAELLQD